MARTFLPTDQFISNLEALLEGAGNPQAGLDAALLEMQNCSGASGGICALQLPGEGQPRLISITGLPQSVLKSKGMERSIIMTLQGNPPEVLLRRQVRAALPLPSPSGYQGVLLLFGRTPLENIDCLYAAAAALGSWSERQRRGAVPADATLLLRSRNTLRALFDNLPLSLYIIGSSYNLVALNKSRADRARGKPSELVGQKCYRALFGRSEPCTGCLVAESLENGTSTSRLARHGSRRTLVTDWEISSFPVPGSSGDGLQAILMEMDVTEKNTLEANLVQSEKMAAIGQLAAGVAHEINNPLAAILANAQILERELPDDDNLQESLELIQMAGSRAAEVVNGLLGYSRREEYQFKPLDINDNIRKTVLLVQHEADNRHAPLKMVLADRLPRIRASSTHLQGVWTNLILNGLDAAGTDPVEIQIITSRSDDGVQIVIRDNGKGIIPADLERIFEPFYTTKGPGMGTGLGLSITQRVIRHHGGTIEVESEPGSGTTFTIHLPRIPPEAR